MNHDKRKHKRTGCQITSTVKEMDTAGRPALTETTVSDISEGGIRFRLNKFVPVQNRLYVTLNVPNRKPIETLAQPAWIREIPAVGQFEIGAKFLTLSPEDHRTIQSLLKG